MQLAKAKIAVIAFQLAQNIFLMSGYAGTLKQPTNCLKEKVFCCGMQW